MLTETLADVSGQSDASVARLHGIEQQLERASGLDDIRLLRESLASCLTAVKEAAVLQRKATLSTVERLRDHIDRAPQPPPSAESRALSGAETADYAVVFKLQRAEHVLTRFGEAARDQMLSVIDESLKSVAGPKDRLMRWTGPSFVMLISTSDSFQEVRRRLSAAV
jgi:GGDEF domain-containing protein